MRMRVATIGFPPQPRRPTVTPPRFLYLRLSPSALTDYASSPHTAEERRGGERKPPQQTHDAPA